MDKWLFAASNGTVRPTDAVDAYWNDRYGDKCPYKTSKGLLTSAPKRPTKASKTEIKYTPYGKITDTRSSKVGKAKNPSAHKKYTGKTAPIEALWSGHGSATPQSSQKRIA